MTTIFEYGMSENRKFKKLRISLTDTCNMACTYCVPENHVDGLRAQLKPSLSAADLISIVKELHSSLRLKKIRITGGEPLIYPHIVHFISEIKKLGIDDIALTTNGYYLEKLAPRLKKAGLRSINISIDAIDEDVFEQMTRKPMLQQTLGGIQAAIDNGFDVKLNTVVLKDINQQQILPLIKFGMQKGISVRFLELMKMGYLHHSYQNYFLSQAEILDEVKKEFNITKKLRIASATSNYWEINDSNYDFGIIANESEPFCKDCDRLRLDSYGKIYGCISATKGISILHKINKSQSIESDIVNALKQKQPIRFIGNDMSMRHIGG